MNINWESLPTQLRFNYPNRERRQSLRVQCSRGLRIASHEDNWGSVKWLEIVTPNKQKPLQIRTLIYYCATLFSHFRKPQRTT